MNPAPEPVPRPRYRWPWFALLAFLLFVLLAVLWMSKEVARIKQQRIRAPEQTTGTTPAPRPPAPLS
jgi:hypothetical protein